MEYDKKEKVYLIIGFGILGQSIAEELSKNGKVIITDLKSKNELLDVINKYTYFQYTNEIDFLKIIVDFLNKPFDSIINTACNDLESAQLISKQMEQIHVNHFTSIGTLMTYNLETWRKLNPKTDIFYNKYQYDKLISENYLLQFCIKNSIKFYIPETFHIIGAGYGIGIAGPFFRMNKHEFSNYKKHSSLILPNNDCKVWIDKNDFTKIIASDLKSLKWGFCPIYNPKLINPEIYYKAIDKLIGLNRQVYVMGMKTKNPICMNRRWVPEIKTCENFNFTDLEESLKKSIDYLLDRSNPDTRNIFKTMSNLEFIPNIQAVQDTQYLPIQGYVKSGSHSSSIIYEKYKNEIDLKLNVFFDGNEEFKENIVKQVSLRRQNSFNEVIKLNPDILIDLGGGFYWQ